MLARAFVVALIAAVAGVGPVAAAAAPIPATEPAGASLGAVAVPKVVIVVGPVESSSTNYRSYGDAVYAEAIKFTPDVTKIYTPNATWDVVKPALQGANIVVYIGHGNGFPSPYSATLNPKSQDGMGLNDSRLSDLYHAYYGESYLASEVRLAPNAIVLLNHLCYASGNSEPGQPDPTLDVAEQRVDNFGAGFLAAGASAVVAEGHSSVTGIIDDLFLTKKSIFDIWRTQWNAHGNTFTFPSTRSPGLTAAMDPDTPTGGYYRSLVGDLSVTADQVVGGAAAPIAASAPSTYVPIAPTRVVDTRTATGLPTALAPRIPQTFQVTGAGAVPDGAVAVTANVTVTNAKGAGYVSLTPGRTTAPATSTLNFPAADTRANGVTLPLSASGTLWAVFMGSGSVDLVVDISGYFVPDASGAGYVAVTPARLVDTRTGNGLTGPLLPGAPRTFQVAGRGGVPAGATAVTVNVTDTNATGPGYISVTPTPTSTPTTSVVNFPAGDIRANGLTLPLAPDGTLSAVFMGTGQVHLVIDVTGYFAVGSGAPFVAVDPARVVDTRIGNGLPSALLPNTPQTFVVGGRGGVAAGASAVTINVTMTGATGAGYISLTPDPTPSPTTSTINFPAGDTRANGVTVPLSGTGSLSGVFKGSGSVQLIVDVTGYFAN